jgi:opacity protein-like surface antigen
MGARLSLVLGSLLVATAIGRSASAEWVVVGYLGGAATSSSSLDVSQPARQTAITVDPVQWDGQSTTPPLYYGYRVTYFLGRTPWLGFESEFIHLKVYAETGRVARVSGTWEGRAVDGKQAIDEFVQYFSISHGVNLLLASVVARVPLGGGPSPRLWATARAGAGPTIPHAESRIGGVASPEGYAVGRVGVQLGAGLEARLGRHLVAIGEYKLTRTRQEVDVTSGSASTRLLSHHVIAGLGWRF